MRKVLTYRPFGERWPGWVALGIGIVLVELGLNNDGPPTASIRLWGHVIYTLPTAAAFFYGSQMKGIYIGPPGHRPLPQGDEQSGDQDNASAKPKDHPRRD